MKDFKKSKLTLLILAAFSFALAILSVFLTFLFGRELSYIPMTVFTVIAAVSFYAFAFFYGRRISVRAYEKIVNMAKDGVNTVSALSLALGIKEKALAKIIKKGKKRAFIETELFCEITID